MYLKNENKTKQKEKGQCASYDFFVAILHPNFNISILHPNFNIFWNQHFPYTFERENDYYDVTDAKPNTKVFGILFDYLVSLLFYFKKSLKTHLFLYNLVCFMLF